MDREQLIRLVAERNTNQGALAAFIGISADKLSKTLNRKRQLKLDEANRAQQFFGLPDEEDDRPRRQLPIVGLVSAGRYREGFESVIGYMPSPDPSLGKDAFVVIVEGGSMNQIAEPGEAIIVDPGQRELIDGKFYVIRNSLNETTFKQYRENPARLVPCSDEDGHETIYPGQDGFEVIGRARKKVSDL